MQKIKVGDWVTLKEDKSIIFRVDKITEDKGGNLYWSKMKNEIHLHYEFYESELEKWVPMHNELVVSKHKAYNKQWEVFPYTPENWLKADAYNGKNYLPLVVLNEININRSVMQQIEDIAIDVAAEYVSNTDPEDVVELIFNKFYQKIYEETNISSRTHLESILNGESDSSLKEVENVINIITEVVKEYLLTLEPEDFEEFVKEHYDAEFKLG